MLCPKCQHRNPDENRFCGHCGCDLTETAQTIYPREGYDEADLPPVSDLGNEIPHFRRDVPPLAQSEYGPPVEVSRDDVQLSRPPIVERPSEPTPSSLPPREVAPEPPRESMRSYGSSTGILFNLAPKETTRVSEPPPREPVRTHEPVESERAFVHEPARRSEGIHGPSFLGLADGADPDFLDDLDEPESHSRRNWFLLALAIVIVLAAVQWRNIRDTGLNFAGSMKLNLPHKKGEQPKTTETAATNNPSENGPANNGKPEIVVDQENKNQAPPQSSAQAGSANASNNGAQAGPGAEQQGAAPSTTPPDSAAKSNTDQAAPSSSAKNDNTQAKTAAPDNTPTQQAKNNAPSADDDANTDNSADDNSSDTDTAAPAAKAPKKSARSARSAAPKAPASSAGAEELTRANSASSPETAAKWLWASTSKGNLDAPVRLADMYANGNGVPKDCEQATVLLRSSARRGNPRASARLGMYYATGQCVPQDRPQAWHWLALAHQRDPNSDWITQYRQRLWSEMSPDERARAGNGPSASASE